jgi:hypothetical protein
MDSRRKNGTIPIARVVVTTMMTRVTIRKLPKRMGRREKRQKNKRRRNIMNNEGREEHMKVDTIEHYEIEIIE